jgi:hypothetical protein
LVPEGCGSLRVRVIEADPLPENDAVEDGVRDANDCVDEAEWETDRVADSDCVMLGEADGDIVACCDSDAEDEFVSVSTFVGVSGTLKDIETDGVPLVRLREGVSVEEALRRGAERLLDAADFDPVPVADVDLDNVVVTVDVVVADVDADVVGDMESECDAERVFDRRVELCVTACDFDNDDDGDGVAERLMERAAV